MLSHQARLTISTRQEYSICGFWRLRSNQKCFIFLSNFRSKLAKRTKIVPAILTYVWQQFPISKSLVRNKGRIHVNLADEFNGKFFCNTCGTYPSIRYDGILHVLVRYRNITCKFFNQILIVVKSTRLHADELTLGIS